MLQQNIIGFLLLIIGKNTYFKTSKTGLLMKLRNLLKAFMLLACASFVFTFSYSQTTFITYRSIWKYWDQNSRPAGWETSGFNDASWLSDSAELGYGDNDEATIISFGPNSADKYRTA